MAFLKYKDLGISGLAACVPSKVIDNYKATDQFDEKDVKEIVDKIGVKERRFTDEHTTASDLCYTAAEKLIADMDVDKSEIDLLVFISQTPDYRMPATAFLLQDRLGLSKKCIAFDVNIGCSGFIYGLSIVYSFMQQGTIRKALLLDGETRSKVYSRKDRTTGFIFGDAGAAAIIERDEKFGESFFSLNSDGKRSSLIQIDAGGYRKMSNEETVKEKVVDEYGNIRSDEQAHMSGADVFNFLIREVPKDIKGTLAFADKDINDFDHYIFHQANIYMNSYLIKKMKLDKSKVPFSIAKYGNTSSVSIPLTMVSELRNELKEQKKLLLSGFGVGLSWATGLINLENCYIPEIIEYGQSGS